MTGRPMKEITRLHVPSKIKYTKLVEDFTYSLGEHIYPDDDGARNRLSAVMNEVFTNIVKHSDTSNQDEMVRFQMEIESGSLVISIYDNGPGIEVESQLPPYDKSLIGKHQKLRKVIDGIVYLTVLDPNSLSFYFVKGKETELQNPESLDDLRGHGLGLSIVTKIMDSITYTSIGDGMYDWKMTKKL
jgi:anti-sigma regulatory factor (Ser/Thr protein kinase)